ncbi:MAG: esterase-like activity of phytase family protein [Acidimicrobiia bacterium]
MGVQRGWQTRIARGRVARSAIAGVAVAVSVAVSGAVTAPVPASAVTEVVDNPGLLLARSIVTNPFVGSTTRPADSEGLAYVPRDNSIWLADDNAHRLYEVDKDTGELKRTIPTAVLAAAPRLGGSDLAGLDTASDFEAMAYDAANDTLYAFSGRCCFPNIRAAAFRLVRDAYGVFQVESFQPFSAPLNDFSGVGVVGTTIWMALGFDFYEYDYATNTISGPFTIPSIDRPILGISDSIHGGDVWVVSKDVLYRVDAVSRTVRPNYAFALDPLGVLDARSVAVVNDQLFVTDGYDGYAPGSLDRFAIRVFDVVDLDAEYVPVVPARLLDTRAGMNTIDRRFSGIGMRAAGSVTELQVTGRGGVPTNAGAVVLNVTVTEAQGPGFVTVYPCEEGVPNAANLNYLTGSTIPNAVIAKVGPGGTTCLYTTNATHLVVDVNGFHPAGSSFVSLSPVRLLDSREGFSTFDGVSAGIGVRPTGSVTELQVTGRAGIPADAEAVVLNVAVTEAQAPGFVTVFPCDGGVPNAANLNYLADSTIPNAVVAKIGAGGVVCLFVMEATHLVVDVNGYYPAGSSFVSLSPVRLLDSREGFSTFDGVSAGIGVRPAGFVTELQVTGRAGIPTDAEAVVLNVAVTEAQAPGFVTVFPCAGGVPNAANLNYLAGSTIPNAVIAKIGKTGTICFFTLAATHLVVDVNGYHPAT